MVPREMFFLAFLVLQSSAGFGETQIKLGEVPEVVRLFGDDGGRLNGEAWSSAEMTGKTFIFMYIDPDQRDDNEALQFALKDQAYGPDNLGSVAIINMAATWYPNVAINANLSSKQKEFPHTVYVKDMQKVMVKKWGLADDSYCVLLFDKTGKLLFRKDGKMTNDEVKTVIKLAWQQIDPSKVL